MSNRVPIESKIYLISGKGGVGKSSVAAALGQNFAKKGLRTLIVELGENSYFNYLFAKNFSFEPQSIGSNLDLATWSGENCLKEFIAYYIRLTKIVDLFFENKIMKTLVKAAPALHELAILGKLTSGPRKIGPELRYDRIVLDGFSSGHFLSLLR
ncbi:MAG: P-loop NTPase, partial [Bdellovibrionales bacterium]|nr:P-loop NTPase [Bdellovibrionales bacterium]